MDLPRTPNNVADDGENSNLLEVTVEDIECAARAIDKRQKRRLVHSGAFPKWMIGMVLLIAVILIAIVTALAYVGTYDRNATPDNTLEGNLRGEREHFVMQDEGDGGLRMEVSDDPCTPNPCNDGEICIQGSDYDGFVCFRPHQ